MDLSERFVMGNVWAVKNHLEKLGRVLQEFGNPTVRGVELLLNTANGRTFMIDISEGKLCVCLIDYPCPQLPKILFECKWTHEHKLIDWFKTEAPFVCWSIDGEKASV